MSNKFLNLREVGFNSARGCRFESKALPIYNPPRLEPAPLEEAVRRPERCFKAACITPPGGFDRNPIVKANRPVNLDIGTISLPITAKASILHRVSGVFMVAGVAVLLYLFDLSLASPEGFAEAQTLLAAPLAKLVLWAVTAGLIYHTVAGIKHLIMDMGIGETLEGGTLGAYAVFMFSAILIAMAGFWIW